MKYRSVVPLNSAPDAGVRINRFQMSPEAAALLDELKIPDGLSIAELAAEFEHKMRLMNPEQCRRLLQLMAELKEADNA